MTYATLQDLVDRFGTAEVMKFCDRDRDQVADPDLVARLLEDAGAIVDGYVGGRYSLPLAEADPLLKRLVCDLVRADYHGSSLESGGPIDAAKRQALATLRDIADGRVELTRTTSADGAAVRPGGGGLSAGPAPVFGDHALGGFV
ncbi:MAG: hypothetical protein RLY86_694 [Pseudomonadota bacterium]|jgi:phage gp36-like protein